MLDIAQLSLLGVVALIGYLVLVRGVGAKQDPREPPVVYSPIPVIGHLIGLIRYGSSYFSMLRDLGVGKTYIFTTPSLVSAVQRNHKVITFEPFLAVAADRMAGLDSEGCRIMNEKQPSTGRPLGMDILLAMHDTLVGPGLDKMNERVIVGLKRAIDELASRAGTPLDLVAWCRDAMLIPSAEALWGRVHPFRTKALQDAFWDYDTNLTLLLLKFVPWLIARSAWKARNLMQAAFLEYYKSNGIEDASDLAKLRWNMHYNAGLSIEDIAKQEVSMTLGVFSNTGPMAFWMLFDLLSRPDLLEQVRSEIRTNALHVEDNKCTIDLSDIRDYCPLMVAVFQESLRVRTRGTPIRSVMADVLLNNQYLLKKGSVVQIPTMAVHCHDDVWGSNSASFDATRFVKGTVSEKESRKVGGFLGFGISPHICPGRHFASGEILAVVSALILQFDVQPVSGEWKEPKLNLRPLAPSVTPPGGAVNVTVTPRAEYKGFEWEFQVKKGKGQIGLIIG